MRVSLAADTPASNVSATETDDERSELVRDYSIRHAGQMNDDGLAERMKYAMLGEDLESSEFKIEKYTGEVDWSYLKPHCERGNLLWVDPSLDIKDIAQAFIDDETAQVADWLGNGDLIRVGDLHAAQWEKSEQLFTAVVVTPFVLMQEIRG